MSDANASSGDTAGAPPDDDVWGRHSAFMEANLRRNYTTNLTHGVFGMTGFRLIYAPTIIPAYLYLLTGSAAAVGLGTALLQLGGTVSPILSGAQVESRKRILPYAIIVGSMMRVMVLVLAIAAWTLEGTALLVVTLAAFLLLGFFSGAQRVAFQMPLGNGYATTFLLAFILTSVGLFVLRLGIREPDAPRRRPAIPLSERIGQFGELLRHRDFRAFLWAHGLAAIARVGLPFWTLYVGDRLGLDGALIGTLSFAFLAADTMSNLVWGSLGDRFGFRAVYLGALISSLVGMLLLVLGEGWLVYASFVFLGFGFSGWMMAAVTLVLEFGEHEDIPMRLALTTTVEGGVSSVGPILVGLSIAALGYAPLIVAAFASLLASLALMLWRVREPRTSA